MPEYGAPKKNDSCASLCWNGCFKELPSMVLCHATVGIFPFLCYFTCRDRLTSCYAGKRKYEVGDWVMARRRCNSAGKKYLGRVVATRFGFSFGGGRDPMGGGEMGTVYHLYSIKYHGMAQTDDWESEPLLSPASPEEVRRATGPGASGVQLSGRRTTPQMYAFIAARQRLAFARSLLPAQSAVQVPPTRQHTAVGAAAMLGGGGDVHGLVGEILLQAAQKASREPGWSVRNPGAPLGERLAQTLRQRLEAEDQQPRP